MRKKTYELLEHTADIRIRVKAASLKSLFKTAAVAMFDIIAEKKRPGAKPEKKFTVKQSAETKEELFINWLNELLSLSAIKEIIFTQFQIKTLDENRIEAILAGIPLAQYTVNKEIKAATYHELEIKKTLKGWQAEVIFDV